MEPQFDVDADEPLLMARYLSSAGGLWPHLPPALAGSPSLFRTASSPVGSLEQFPHVPAAARMLHSRSVASNLSIRSVDFPLQPDADAGCFGTEDTSREPSGQRPEAGTQGIRSWNAKAAAPCTMPDVAASEKCRERSSLGSRTSRLSQLASQPLIRVVDFNVSRQIDEPVGELPMTSSRCGPKSGLSMLLNAPA